MIERTGITRAKKIPPIIKIKTKIMRNFLDKYCHQKITFYYSNPISLKYFFAPGWNGTETPVTAAFAETSLPFA